MTKSTITRERAQQIFLGNGPEPSASEERELARIALAAMDSEPVAVPEHITYISEPTILNILANDDSSPMANAARILAYEVRFWRSFPLYRHAQPAPVVMDDTKLRELFDSWFASDCSFDLSPEASEADNIAWRESYWYVWKRCRATILAAARQSPGSDLATVPGKWIPVSERMPEVGVKVLCFPVKDEPIHATFNGQLWLQDVSWSGSEEPIDNVIPVTVTHWMPLPAGPQEVKGE
ncbi:DUF551 domain-containing protein [Klebsiella quasipneumoniae subsp. quasipneumoniae]|nr:DUF551 domain-containing protein [Klebsiella quasipneumoniae]MCS5748420.1 DUF551 domain-containing protein [Klebsiella quasipneumoniae subsp. quasipneumoniae]